MRGLWRSARPVSSNKGRPLPEFLFDEEVPRKQRHDLEEEAVHMMQPMGGQNWTQQSNIVYSGQNGSALYGQFEAQESKALIQRDLYRFYNRAVKSLQEKVGDAEHAPISGNIYRYLAFRDFGLAAGLFQIREQDQRNAHFTLGIKLVIVVQIIGPISLVMWTFHQMLISDKYLGMHVKTAFGLQEEILNYKFLEIIVGALFVMVFQLNSLYIIETDMKQSKKLIHMSKVFDAYSTSHKEKNVSGAGYSIPGVKSWYLFLGAVVNTLCLSLCGAGLVLAFYNSEDGIKDFVFDALGLLFLSNLDDQDGDLRFIGDKWDADFFGDIYGELADEKDTMEMLNRDRDENFSPDNIYLLGFWVARAELYVLPVLFIFMELFSD